MSDAKETTYRFAREPGCENLADDPVARGSYFFGEEHHRRWELAVAARHALLALQSARAEIKANKVRYSNALGLALTRAQNAEAEIKAAARDAVIAEQARIRTSIDAEYKLCRQRLMALAEECVAAESRIADLKAKLAEAERRNAQHVIAYDELAAGMAEVAAQRDASDAVFRELLAMEGIEGMTDAKFAENALTLCAAAIERHRSKAAGSHE